MLMDYNHTTRWQLTCIVVSLSISLLHQTIFASQSYDRVLLDRLARDRAMQTLKLIGHTGILYTVSLPGNYSGIQVSTLRLRSFSLWKNGANLTSFKLPPKVKSFPFVKRLFLVYKNLGNWSSYYYKVPGHRLIAPVVGFLVYDATSITASRRRLQFAHRGDRIVVHFPEISDKKDKNETPKCVRFSVNGLIHFMDMRKGDACVTTGAGHYSVVVKEDRNVLKKWIWWVVVLGGGGIGLVMLGFLGFNIVRLWRNRNTRMENESENGVGFETTRVGMSRMPSASAIRTQPNIEHGYVP